MRREKRRRRNWLKIFIISAIILVSSESLLAQDPCDAKKEFDDAVTEAKGAANKLTKPANPTGEDGGSLSKSTLQQNLKAAKEAKDKTEARKNEAESALKKANEAVTNFKNEPLKGVKLATLKTEIATLENQIKKAQQASSKISPQDRIDLNNFKRDEVKPLEIPIKRQMPGLSLEEAKEKAEDTGYDNFSNEKIDAIKAEIARNKTVIENMNKKYHNTDLVPTAGDDEQSQKAQAAIAAETAKLQPAIDECRKNVIENLKPLRKKEQEYEERLAKLYPDEETRKLIDSLAELENNLRTKKLEEKTLSDEQKKLQDAVKPAQEKLEGGIKDGKSFTGDNRAYEDEEKKVKAIEQNLKKFEDYDKKNKEWTDAEKKKTDADKKIKDKETAYNTAVTEKNTALTNARTAAALSTLDARLAVVNSALMTDAKKEILEDSAVMQLKERLSLKIKTLQTEPEKVKLRQQWKAYIEKRVRPHYIRKRNQAEADRLRAIRDDATLQKFNCFTDVGTFINLLGQTMSEVLSRKASIPSDMDDGAAAAGADEQIPVGPIPPLDEDAKNAGNEIPTDEVPDDITKNTGEVKVIQYFVFLLTNSSNGLYVGSEDSLKGRIRCSFEGGGINCSPTDVITYRKLLGPFASQDEAHAGLCKSITESRIFPLAVGLKGRWQGGSWYGLWDSSTGGCSK